MVNYISYCYFKTLAFSDKARSRNAQGHGGVFSVDDSFTSFSDTIVREYLPLQDVYLYLEDKSALKPIKITAYYFSTNTNKINKKLASAK